MGSGLAALKAFEDLHPRFQDPPWAALASTQPQGGLLSHSMAASLQQIPRERIQS